MVEEKKTCRDTSACSVMNVGLYLLHFLIVPVWSRSACLMRCFPSSEASRHRVSFTRERRGTEQIMQPCNALMSCHTIRHRLMINLDNLSCHNIIGSFFLLADICVCSPVRRRKCWTADPLHLHVYVISTFLEA